MKKKIQIEELVDLIQLIFDNISQDQDGFQPIGGLPFPFVLDGKYQRTNSVKLQRGSEHRQV